MAHHLANEFQRDIWLAMQAMPRPQSFLMHRAFFSEDLPPASRIADGVDEVLRRVPQLTAAFDLDGEDVVGVVGARNSEATTVVVADTWNEDDLRRYLASVEFDATRPPLFRALIVQTARTGRSIALVLSAHHIVLDGIAFQTVIQGLFDFLEDGGSSMFSAAQVGLVEPPSLRPAAEDWSTRLNPLPEVPRVSLTRGTRRGRGSLARCAVIGHSQRERLRGVCRRTNVSMATVVRTLYAMTLHKVFDLDRLVVTSQVDVRPASCRDAIGMYTTPLPEVSVVSLTDTWRDVLERSHRSTLGMLRLRWTSAVATALRPRRRRDGSSCLTDFEFSYLGSGIGGVSGLSRALLAAEVPVLPVDARYAVSLQVIEEASRSRFEWVLDGALHVEADLDLLIEAFDQLFGMLLLDLDSCPAEGDIMTRSDVAAALDMGRGPLGQLRVDSLAAVVHQQATCTPAATAIAHEEERVTYSELSAAVAFLQQGLRDLGCVPGDRVATLCPRGPLHIAAMLAIIGDGYVYIPLEPADPPGRTGELAERVGARVIVGPVVRQPRIDLGSEPGPRRWDVSFAQASSSNLPIAAPEQARARDAPAYVVFTSGSTGTPQAVEIGIGALLNHLDMMIERLGNPGMAALGQTASVAFDIHVWQCLAPLMVGGTIVVMSDETMRDVVELEAVLDTGRVASIELVPTLLRLLVALRAGDPMADCGLLWLIVTGETLDGGLAGDLLSIFPEATVLNAYGPAEAADDVTLGSVSAEFVNDTVVPIGWPERNAEMYLADRWGRVRPHGVEGEIVIAGPVLANGYLGASSDRGFFPHPYQDGARAYRTGDIGIMDPTSGFRCFGRRDDQVKLGGRRVELSEIDAGLRSIAGVTDAGSAVRADGPGAELVAVVVAEVGVTGAFVRSELQLRLPSYMVPRRIAVAEVLPQGPTGKVDRRAVAALGAPPEGDRAVVEASNAVGRAVTQAWRAVLPEGAALGSGFFEAGGDSIAAVRLIARLTDQGFPGSMRLLYENQELSAFVEAVRSISPPDPSTRVRVTDPVPASSAVLEMLEAIRAGAGVPVLALSAPSSMPVASLKTRVEDVVGRLPAFGLLFDVRGTVRNPLPGSIPQVAWVDLSRPPDVSVDQAIAHAVAVLDVGHGLHVAVIVTNDEAMIVMSHLVADIATAIGLEEALVSDPVPPATERRQSSDYVKWLLAREDAQRARRAGLGFDDYVGSIASSTRAQARAWRAARTVPADDAAVRCVSHHDFEFALDRPLTHRELEHVALGVVAHALGYTLGLREVRVDIERDGRDLFGYDASVADAGCYAVLVPVVVSVEHELGYQELLWRAAVARDAVPGDDLWEVRGEVTADDLAVPVVNIIGTLSTGVADRGFRLLPEATVWNAVSDRHALVIDVGTARHPVEDRAVLVMRVTSAVRPADAAVLEMLLAEMQAICRRGEAQPSPTSAERTVPSGVDTLGLAPKHLVALLAELEDGQGADE